MTTKLENTFKTQLNLLFISKLYSNSLDTLQRLQYVESQIQYTKTHRSIIFRDIKETHVPTTKYKPDNNTKMILTEWITKIQDYQGRPLYLQIFPPVHDLVEAHILTTNVSLAYEWERDCKSHIAKVIEKQDYNKIFNIPIEEQKKIVPSKEIWEVTPAPIIDFLVPQRKAAWKSPIPQTIQNPNSSVALDTKSNTSMISKHKQNKINNTDTNTVITTTTYNSENIELISELQDESRQHLEYIEDHLHRIVILEAQIRELQEIQTWKNRITRLESQISTFNIDLIVFLLQ
jgi:hypothetical protein